MSANVIDYSETALTIVTDSLCYLPSRIEVKPIGFSTKCLALRIYQSSRQQAPPEQHCCV